MTAVVDIIKQALKDTGVYGAGETPSPDDMADSFDLMKQLLGQWQVDGLMVYAQADVSFAATGAQLYTVGTSGNVNTTRPAEVIGAFWRDGATDYPVDVMTSFEDYQAICVKSMGSFPRAVCYVPTYPLGTLYVWPVASSGTMHLTVRSPLPSYASVTDDLSVPPQYELAIRYSLGELLPASFGVPLRPDIAGLAKRARKILKRSNVHIPHLGMPGAVLPGRFNRVRGGFN